MARRPIRLSGIRPTAVLSGPGVSLLTSGFESVVADATAGGQDVARLYDSAGDDTLTAYPTVATLTDGSTYSLEADNFRYAMAYATHGGVDAASFFDSSATTPSPPIPATPP